MGDDGMDSFGAFLFGKDLRGLGGIYTSSFLIGN